MQLSADAIVYGCNCLRMQLSTDAIRDEHLFKSSLLARVRVILHSTFATTCVLTSCGSLNSIKPFSYNTGNLLCLKRLQIRLASREEDHKLYFFLSQPNCVNVIPFLSLYACSIQFLFYPHTLVQSSALVLAATCTCRAAFCLLLFILLCSHPNAARRIMRRLPMVQLLTPVAKFYPALRQYQLIGWLSWPLIKLEQIMCTYSTNAELPILLFYQSDC